MINEIQQLFQNQGGEFISSPSFIQEKLKSIKAYIFDWDGVFNSGTKDENKSSSYSEPDSMGINLLRFGYWLENNYQLPFVAIVTGENNQTAIKLAERESFHHIYFSFKNKAVAFDHFLETFGLKAEEVAFCFDDVLDFPISRKCGLKFMIRRHASPLFTKYAIEHKYCDYITGQQGGNHAIREVSELILGLLDQHNLAVKERTDFSKLYTDYLDQRKTVNFRKLRFDEGIIVEL